jgi:cobalt-zinc-cadmium efflux system protein
MQGIPAGIDSTKIEEEVQQIDGIESVHDIHIWSLDGSRNIMTIHVRLSEDNSGSNRILDPIALKKSIHDRIQQFHIEHVTIELEAHDEDCEYRDC